MDLGIKCIYTYIHAYIHIHMYVYIYIHTHICLSIPLALFPNLDASQIPQAPTHKNTMIEVLVWFNHHSYRKGAGFQTQRAHGMKRHIAQFFFGYKNVANEIF